MNAIKTLSPFGAWMKAATVSEQEMLASRVESSRATLSQYASGHRKASAERAAQIEAVTKEMARASKGRLPIVYRTDLSAACRACPYAQRCLGDKALASEFPVLAQG